VQQGIKAGSSSAQGAADSMVSVPDSPGGRASGGARNITIEIGDIHVHTNARDAGGIAGSIKAELERIFEGVAVQLGAPTPGGA
jgi:hypothetical protein